MKKFQGKIAVITGGNSGIGYATAKELKEQGATVLITGRRKEAIETAALELGVTGIVADQSSVTDTEKLVSRVAADHGRVDILFINAGILGISTIEQAAELHYDSIMDINLKGAYFTLSRFIPVLSDGASVVFLSSNTAGMTTPGASVYSASKAALNSVMKTAALELAPRKIRVNAVSPGPTATELSKKIGFDEDTLKKMKEYTYSKIPLSRTGTAAEVARMVAYFCGEEAGFITGAEIIMDGGLVLV
jgi:NAD(P)-dependent dehydrogenase (short-subunit alcohol dehydrogenase family)